MPGQDGESKVKITADASQLNTELDKAMGRLKDLQSAANIALGGRTGGASSPGGSSSSAGVAAASAGGAPSNPGRGATNGGQMARVTQGLNGSAASPAAASVVPAPSRSGGGSTNSGGSTHVINPIQQEMSAAQGAAGTVISASATMSDPRLGGSPRLFTDRRASAMAASREAATRQVAMGSGWGLGASGVAPPDVTGGFDAHPSAPSDTFSQLAHIRANQRSSRIFIRNGQYVDPNDTVGLFSEEQNIKTDSTMNTRLRGEWRTQNRIRKLRASGIGIADDAGEADLLAGEYDAASQRDASRAQHAEEARRRAAERASRAAERAGETEFSDSLRDAKRHAGMAGYGPNSSLRTRRIQNDKNGAGKFWQERWDRFDEGDYSPVGDVTEEPDDSMMGRLRRFGKTPLGRYTKGFGKGAAYAVGNAATEYFHIKATEELTGRRDDMANANVLGMLVGGLGGAAIGSLFGGFGSVIGASTGAGLGQQAMESLMSKINGPAMRSIQNQNLADAMGWNTSSLEAQNRSGANNWQASYNPLGNAIHSIAPGWLRGMQDSANRALDPEAPLHADVKDLQDLRGQITSLAMQGGLIPSDTQVAGWMGTGRPEQQQLLAYMKRFGMGPSTGYNPVSQYMSMGPMDFFASAPGTDQDTKQTLIDMSTQMAVKSRRYNIETTLGQGQQAELAGSLISGGSPFSDGFMNRQNAVYSQQMASLDATRAQLAAMEKAGVYGTDTPEYAALKLQETNDKNNIYKSNRFGSDARNAYDRSVVSMNYATAGADVSRANILGNSTAVARTSGQVVAALQSDRQAAAEYLSEMDKDGSGYTLAEIMSQRAKVREIDTKIFEAPYSVASQALSRYGLERQTAMAPLGLATWRASQFGTEGQINAAYNAERSARSTTSEGLRQRRSGVGYDEQLRIDQQLVDIQKTDIQDGIAMRDIHLGRQSDAYGLSRGTASNAVAQSARTDGISGYRGSVGNAININRSRIGDIDAELSKGGLTYDQEQRLRRERVGIEGEIQGQKWDALERGIGMRYSIAGNQVRGSGAAMLAAIGIAGQEYGEAGVKPDSPIWGDLNTKRRSAQMTMFHQQDVLAFELPMAQMNAQEQIHQNLPFSPGYGLALSMQRMKLRAPYINQRIGRYNELMSRGDLSEDEQMQQAGEIMGLQVQQSRDLGMLASGGPGRIASIAAGAPSFRGRYDSMSLARTALMNSGHPRRDYGFIGGGQNASDAWFAQFRGEGFDAMGVTKPFSKTGAMDASSSGPQILQVLQAIYSKMGNAGGTFNPGTGMMIQETLMSRDAALRTARIDRSAGYANGTR